MLTTETQRHREERKCRRSSELQRGSASRTGSDVLPFASKNGIGNLEEKVSFEIA